MLNGNAPPPVTTITTSQCRLTNLAPTLMHVDIRDLVEWVSRQR
jgi:hypothetical protein